jgi:ubiquinone/menaquinone biosynthesis C-methylase UbiE
VSFDRVADIYDRTRSLPDEAMTRLVKALASELDGCKGILDVGVGTGRFALPLQKAGLDVIGIDISRKMISKAQDKRVRNLMFADARLLPFKQKAFDVAISVHLLHLISNWQLTLVEICRVTRSFLVSLSYANKEPVGEAYDQLLRRYGYERHRLGKSERELKDVVAPAKCVPVTAYETLSDVSLANFAQRTSSSQWEIPVEVNQKVVDELRGRFAGKTFTQELGILIWRIDDLRTRFEKPDA